MIIRSLLLGSTAFRSVFDDNNLPALDGLSGDGKMVTLNEGKLTFKIGDKTESVDPTEIFTARSKITALNGEAMSHRRERDAAQAKLKDYDGIDPAKAREALGIVEKLDQKKLIDAGEVDRVRSTIEAQYKEQIVGASKERDEALTALRDMRRQNLFTRSKWITENIGIPLDMFESTFAKYVEIANDGKTTIKDAHGNVILSKAPDHIGEPAGFEEAIQALVDAYPNKDAILKGTPNKGSGNPGNGGQTGNSGKKLSRAEYDRADPATKADYGRKLATRELTLVD